MFTFLPLLIGLSLIQLGSCIPTPDTPESTTPTPITTATPIACQTPIGTTPTPSSTTTTTTTTRPFPTPTTCPLPIAFNPCFPRSLGRWIPSLCTWHCLEPIGPTPTCGIRPSRPIRSCKKGWNFNELTCSWFCPWTREEDGGGVGGLGPSCDMPRPKARDCMPAGLWSCDFGSGRWRCLKCALAGGCLE